MGDTKGCKAEGGRQEDEERRPSSEEGIQEERWPSQGQNEKTAAQEAAQNGWWRRAEEHWRQKIDSLCFCAAFKSCESVAFACRCDFFQLFLLLSRATFSP